MNDFDADRVLKLAFLMALGVVVGMLVLICMEITG